MKQQLRVLLIEDMPEDVELIRRELNKTGMAVSCQLVETEEKFLKHLWEQPPDIILSDHGVPGFGGRTALKLARKWVPDVPFLLVTGATNLDTQGEAEERADGHVSKNSLGHLADAVKRVLKRGHLREQAHQVEAALRDSESRLEALATNPHNAGESRPESRDVEHDVEKFLEVTVQQVRRQLAEVETILKQASERPELLTPDVCASIAGSGKAVERMVEELVGSNRDARAPLFPMPVRVADVVRQMMRDCTEENPGRQIEWVIRPLPQVVADPSLVDTALRGMAGYVLALTRGETPGRIEIRSEERDDEIRIGFFHNGQQPVTEPAEPLETYCSSASDATSVAATAGLARASAAAKRNGGRLWMGTSAGMSALWLSLPKASDQAS